MVNGISGVNMMSGVYGISPYGGRYGSYGAIRTADASQIVRTQPVQRTGAVPVVRSASNIGMPVEPIRPIGAVKAGAASGVGYVIPFLRKGMDPAELSVRMRMQYGEGAQTEPSKAEAGTEEASDTTGAESVQKAAREGECKTCEQRKYQDGSDDAGVSFKSPTHIAPEQASSAVLGHEMEHVVRERAKAVREDKEVVSQSVTIHTAVCPECGKVYVSGGTTKTTTAEKVEAGTAAPDSQERRQGTSFSAVA